MAEPQEVVGTAFRGGVGSDPTGSVITTMARRRSWSFCWPTRVSRISLHSWRGKTDQDLTGGRIGLRRYGFDDGDSSGWSRGPSGASVGRAVGRWSGSWHGWHAWVAVHQQPPMGSSIEPAGW